MKKTQNTKYTYMKTNESMHGEMGPVWQNPSSETDWKHFCLMPKHMQLCCMSVVLLFVCVLNTQPPEACY